MLSLCSGECLFVVLHFTLSEASQLPFAEDVRKYRFPSLTTVTTASGKALTEHKKLPTPGQQEAMDKFVEAMSLVGLEKTEDSSQASWFDISKSFHPSVHRIRECTIDRALHGKSTLQNAMDAPDPVPGQTGPSSRLPPVDPELVKYFAQPPVLQKKNAAIITELKSLMDVKKGKWR